MSLRDVEWAYSLDLPMREKVVLVALCFRADAKSHETIVGQQTIAEMTGASPDTVRRALDALDERGVITRERRHGPGGYRTSDRTTVNSATYPADSTVGEADESTAYPAQSLVGAEPSRQTAYKADSGHLTSTQRSPNPHTAGAINDPSVDPSVDPSDTPLPPDRFDEFYAVWPKKVDKPAAKRAWAKAVRRVSPEVIIAAAVAFRDNPHIPPKQYIRNPATWLNGDGWDDDLPAARGNSKPTPTERALQTVAAGASLSERRTFGNITSFNRQKEIS